MFGNSFISKGDGMRTAIKDNFVLGVAFETKRSDVSRDNLLYCFYLRGIIVLSTDGY